MSLNRLGVPHRYQQPWTEEEKDAVRQYYRAVGPTRLGRILKRSAKSVAGMADRMGLTRSWNERYSLSA